jgi:hypothetical protein
MHSNKVLLDLAQAEMHQELLSMSTRRDFSSADYLDAFAAHAPNEYAQFRARYTNRGWDLPHATQIAHREIMHTVKNKFRDLVTKVGEAPNPRGGTMSIWRRNP